MQQVHKEKMILKAFAKVLSDERSKINKSQRIFAFENDLHKSMISRFESCSSEPKLFSIWKLANALGLKPSQFFDLIENELPEDFSYLVD